MLDNSGLPPSMIPFEIIEQLHATPADIETRTGHLAYIRYLDDRFVVSTLHCDCPDISVAVYANGQESNGDLQAVYVCAVHGLQQSYAQRLDTDADRATLGSQMRQVFSGASFRVRKHGVLDWGAKRGTA